ncbi:flagellar biosynthesis anti-sigma factor FlgM [Piscinibacter sakaiensis]|uniref:flagellar biosynthesis anti-sigma factor FlgM n=1 Tax=Piscinibacter sakaiensis TaxID=1547922 RepID=UPI003AABECCE
MKIGNPIDKPGLQPVATPRGKAADAERTTAAGSTGSAKVELSNAATTLLDGADADFDAAKVERISNAISQGQFKVNPEAIADKLLANARELLSRPH